MTRPAVPTVEWHEHRQARTVALNVAGRYYTLVVELVLGLVMLPFNTRYLGASDYGLWMLAASIVAYFSMLDLGYGVAMERFVAHYRARRDARAINEIASTLVLVFAAVGLLGLLLAAGIAANIAVLFDLDATRARTGGLVLLFIGAQFALGFPFAVFGAICNGFQRTYLNAVVGTVVALAVMVVNVAVLHAGFGLVELVAATTATRMTGYAAYRLNAYRVFPLLRVRPSLFRMGRVREMSEFSAYTLMQDVSNKVNYATDPIVIAAVLTTGAVAVWTVAQRLADVVLQLMTQFSDTLFPIIVECDTGRRDDRLRDLLIQGTRLSLATVLPVAGGMALMARPVVLGWTGPDFAGAVAVLQILAVVVVIRVGSATAGTVLYGAGRHRLVAGSNAVAAAANIVLSVALIFTHGLPGVAIATLIPITGRAVGVLIPLACARVGLPLTRFVTTAVWPAAWPAVVALACLALVRDPETVSLGSAVMYGAGSGLLYAVLFLGVAIGRHDRGLYIKKLRSIAGRPALETAA
jgi:O-antigen/teichoic acid export membrane protein